MAILQKLKSIENSKLKILVFNCVLDVVNQRRLNNSLPSVKIIGYSENLFLNYEMDSVDTADIILAVERALYTHNNMFEVSLIEHPSISSSQTLGELLGSVNDVLAQLDENVNGTTRLSDDYLKFTFTDEGFF